MIKRTVLDDGMVFHTLALVVPAHCRLFVCVVIIAVVIALWWPAVVDGGGWQWTVVMCGVGLRK